MTMKYAEKHNENTPARCAVLSGYRGKDYRSVNVVGLEAVAGDAAAGDLVGGEGTVVLVGEVEEAVDFGGLLEPVDKGCHLGVGGVGCAWETDVYDDEGHVVDSEVSVVAFPQTELDVAAVVEVVDTSSDCIPVEGYVIGVTAEYIDDICSDIKVNIQDGVAS